MKVKDWFLNKNMSANERYAISTADEPTIKRETEKAYLLEWSTDYGKLSKWVPKSCTEETVVVVNNEIAEILDRAATREEELTDMFTGKRGVKVKKIGGRKVFTIKCDYPTYGQVWLDNGKKVNIHELQFV